MYYRQLPLCAKMFSDFILHAIYLYSFYIWFLAVISILRCCELSLSQFELNWMLSASFFSRCFSFIKTEILSSFSPSLFYLCVCNVTLIFTVKWIKTCDYYQSFSFHSHQIVFTFFLLLASCCTPYTCFFFSTAFYSFNNRFIQI